jgi:geranylgeranyl diphosphate synthase, type I
MNKTSAATQADTAVFKAKLTGYKQRIDDDIAAYCKQIEKSTLQNYGAHARLSIDAYISILRRGGKRIRGALTMMGYEMSRPSTDSTSSRQACSHLSLSGEAALASESKAGSMSGRDSGMILQAARAVEMIQAYILIVDDFQDQSDIRRGGPAAHKLLTDYHLKQHFSGNAKHFGESIAMNAALAGNHAAQMVLANLEADPELRLKAISILNRTMLTTAHGQTNDIMNEVVADVSEADVDRVLEWKTAHYTVLNPLHMGMVLAGADCHATDAITDYAMHTGRAFQITDDILGTFGEEFESGKSPLDDIREGKRTLLTVYALDHTTNGNKNFLIQMLGNHRLTQTEFRRCKDILVESAALDHAHNAAQEHVQAALLALDKEQHRWSIDGVQFLRGLSAYLLVRTA